MRFGAEDSTIRSEIACWLTVLKEAGISARWRRVERRKETIMVRLPPWEAGKLTGRRPGLLQNRRPFRLPR